MRSNLIGEAVEERSAGLVSVKTVLPNTIFVAFDGTLWANVVIPSGAFAPGARFYTPTERHVEMGSINQLLNEE